MILKNTNNKNMNSLLNKSIKQGKTNKDGKTLFFLEDDNTIGFYTRIVSSDIRHDIYRVKTEHSVYVFQLEKEELFDNAPRFYLSDTDDNQIMDKKVEIARSLMYEREAYIGEAYGLEDKNGYLVMKRGQVVDHVIKYDKKSISSDNKITYTSSTATYVFMPTPER